MKSIPYLILFLLVLKGSTDAQTSVQRVRLDSLRGELNMSKEKFTAFYDSLRYYDGRIKLALEDSGSSRDRSFSAISQLLVKRRRLMDRSLTPAQKDLLLASYHRRRSVKETGFEIRKKKAQLRAAEKKEKTGDETKVSASSNHSYGK